MNEYRVVKWEQERNRRIQERGKSEEASGEEQTEVDAPLSIKAQISGSGQLPRDLTWSVTLMHLCGLWGCLRLLILPRVWTTTCD